MGRQMRTGGGKLYSFFIIIRSNQCVCVCADPWNFHSTQEFGEEDSRKKKVDCVIISERFAAMCLQKKNIPPTINLVKFLFLLMRKFDR